MFCFSWDNKQTKSKRFALVPIISRPNQNILLQFWKQADQIKLVRFVPEPMGQNGNELLLIQKNSDQTKTFCFRSDLKRTKSKRFAFVPIISFDIGAFLLSFRYRWHYYSGTSMFLSRIERPECRWWRYRPRCRCPAMKWQEKIPDSLLPVPSVPRFTHNLVPPVRQSFDKNGIFWDIILQHHEIWCKSIPEFAFGGRYENTS
jgi:hypothetical protein